MIGIARFFILTLAAAFIAQPSVAAERVRRNVEVEWEAVDDASVYEIKVRRKDEKEKKPAFFKSKSAAWTANIKPGLYEMQVRSYDQRGVPGSWSPASDLLVKLPNVLPLGPSNEQEISSKDNKNQDVKLRWEPVSGASKYRVEVHSIDNSWKMTTETDKSEWSVNAPVAQGFEWNVVAIDPKGEAGEKDSDDFKFGITGAQLADPAIQKPLNKYVRELNWSAPEYANTYNYELKHFNRKNKKWENVEAKSDQVAPHLEMDVSRPSGKYKLTVQAQSPRRVPSKIAEMEFDMRGGFRDPASMENAILRDSLTKPTHFYAIASYLVTSVQYTGINYDANSKPTFDALGGTGRLGMGYQDPRSTWGGFGIVDLSGFIIEGKNFKFASFEAHVTRRFEAGSGLWMVGTGLFSKELPIIKGSEAQGFEGVGKVRQIGPHAGFTYWRPFTERMGMQVNARMYYGLMGSAGNGQKSASSLSYQYGLLGSYRLRSDWMGYAGYAFRTDTARYESNAADVANSFAQPGQINEISIEGHYLNLILEYSF